MTGFLILFIGLLLLIAAVVFEFLRAEENAQAKGYGPKRQIKGKPCARGTFNCAPYNVPRLGRLRSKEYELRLYADRNGVTGTFAHTRSPESFRGSLFLTQSPGEVKGRSLMQGTQVFEGVLHEDGARLTRGYPKGGILGFLRGTFEYSVRNGRVWFKKTTSPGSISRDSEMQIGDGRITGRVFHGPQKTWVLNVDVPFVGINSEAVALAVILACDHILQYAHDGVNSIDESTEL